MYKVFSFLILIVLISACSLDYDSSITESLDESIPTSRLYGVKRVQVQEGKPKVTFEAEEAVVWEEREETELFEFVFNEFDNQRDIITRGEAEYLLISDNNDAEVVGNIYGYSVRNEASVEADNLKWNDEKRILSSRDDSFVIIEMDNGSILDGRGFKADLYTNSTTFSLGISGTLESGTEAEE
jgi:LPS export ABC transporter protein LptC